MNFLIKNNILQEKRLERNKIEIKELVQKEVIKLVNNLQYSEDIDGDVSRLPIKSFLMEMGKVAEESFIPDFNGEGV